MKLFVIFSFAWFAASLAAPSDERSGRIIGGVPAIPGGENHGWNGSGWDLFFRLIGIFRIPIHCQLAVGSSRNITGNLRNLLKGEAKLITKKYLARMWWCHLEQYLDSISCALLYWNPDHWKSRYSSWSTQLSTDWTRTSLSCCWPGSLDHSSRLGIRSRSRRSSFS